MIIHYISTAAILVLFLGDALSSTDVNEANPSPTVTLISEPKVTGSDASKIKLTIPTNTDGFAKEAAKSHTLVTAMISELDVTPVATLKSLPFLNMYRWQKYATIASREYLRYTRFNDKELYKDFIDDFPLRLGRLHDNILSSALDEKDDNVFETRETREGNILRKVKTYFKRSSEAYLRLPLKIDSILFKLEESTESDLLYFAQHVHPISVIKADVPKVFNVKIVCYLNENAMDKKYIIWPLQEIDNFKEKYKITQLDTVKDVISMWICKNERDKLLDNFVLLEMNKIFEKNGEAKSYKFSWLQTYLGGYRVEITDSYRFRFKVLNKPEPTDEEKKQMEYERERKRQIKEKKRKEKERRERRKKSRRKRGRKRSRSKYSSSDDSSDSDD